MQIGSYPFFREGRVGANFVVRATEARLVSNCVEALAGALTEAGHTVTRGEI